MKYYVISHTHWDREWYMPFEQFRARLVKLIDKLIVILEKEPDYIFHLDAQTIVLEDYIEIRPHKRQILERYIRSGNLIIGPWYLQNDFYLTSGEATVRNLMIGSDIAQGFGKCADVGYAPDQFGNVGQLPQVLNNFGIDSFVFARGYSFYDKDNARIRMPNEFRWVGEDGSSCLAVYMSGWYNNAQRFPAEQEKVKVLLKRNDEMFCKLNELPFGLMMNGVDHLEAQDDLIEILEETAEHEGIDIAQTSMESYISDIKKYISDNNITLSEYSGALNHGNDYEMLKGCYSSRVYLKQHNVYAQDSLEHRLEPMCAVLESWGLKGVYDEDYMNYLWKCLLKNHPHDSICGCSRDEVHADMENRYTRLRILTDYLIEQTMRTAHYHMGVSDDLSHYAVTVFNGTESTYSGVVEKEFTFVEEDNIRNFEIRDSNNRLVDFEILDCYKKEKDVFSGLNLPGVVRTDAYRVKILVEGITPLAYAQYTVIPKSGIAPIADYQLCDRIENEFYVISADKDGVTIHDKRSELTYTNAILISDKGDRGDSYVFEPADESDIMFQPEIISVKKCGMDSKLTVKFGADLPVSYNYDRLERSAELVRTEVVVEVSLSKNSGTIGLSYELENKSKQHRLRLMVKAPVAGEFFADAAFEVFNYRDNNYHSFTKSKTVCAATFASVSGNKGGAAVYLTGQHEVERLDGYIAITLLRATGVIARVEKFVCAGGEQWHVPGNEVLRRLSGNIGLDYGINSLAKMYKNAKQYRVGATNIYFDSMDHRRFSGGRYVVQESELKQFYYEADQYEGITVGQKSVLSLSNENIIVTAFFKHGGEIYAHVVNFYDKEQHTQVVSDFDWVQTDLFTKSEYGTIDKENLTFRPKEIKTLKLIIK